MSSVTSTEKDLPPEGGSYGKRQKELPPEGGSYGKRRRDGKATGARQDTRGARPARDSRGFRLRAEDDGASAVDPGFRVWHFFVLTSLVAATVAVVLSRRNTPEHLILISAAVASAGAAAYAFYRTLAPLALPDTLATEPIGDRLRADLEREKMLVLRSIKELEFDRAMGKLSAQDFDEMAGRLRARAIGLMKQLDGGGYRAIIERDLAERLKHSRATAPTSVVNADAAAPIGLCACGVQNDLDARFCKSCGAHLEAA